MDSFVIAPSSNNIEKVLLLLLDDEYRPTCAISMTNPGSLTMGFAGAYPRQLAPSVGTTQVGITISAVPSSASRGSRARTRSNPLEDFKLTTSVSIAPSRLPGPQPHQAQHHDDCQIHHQRKRTRWPRRQARGLYEGIPLEETQRASQDPSTTRRPAATRTPAAQQDSDSETQTGEYYDPDRRPDEFANFIRNQSLSDGIELDPRFHARSEDHAQIF